MLLSMVAHKEQCQNTGACMGADDRTHIADDHFLDTVLIFQHLCQILSILQAITMGDEAGTVQKSL